MQAERLIFLCWNVLSWTRSSPFQRLSVIKWKPEFGSWSAAVLLLSPPAHFLQSGPLQPPQVLAWDSPPTVPLGLSPLFPPPSTLPPLSTASYRCLSPFVLTLTPHTQTDTSSSIPPLHPTATGPPKNPSYVDTRP
ncbi:hypothetical protein NQZ68_001543 [Dissostichus eleginoides]|nr:hypothetical protein NQZ68_001543 [Dissostichus eleginoides]